MSSTGWLYDGESAIRHEVRVGASGRELLIDLADGRHVAVPADRLVHSESRHDAEIYGRSDVPGWRLGLVDPGAEIHALLPHRQVYGRWIDRLGLVRAMVIGIVLSGAVLFAASRFPAWAAPLVPMEWEKKFGDALVGDFGGRFCKGPGGQAALRKLAARLSPDASSLNIRVADIPMVNAAALPGGNIVIFRKLLDEAEGPDEVAGVLAHEIAHVEERHVTEALLRELGVGVVIAAFGGGTGANIQSLLSARYSRDAEREADSAAIQSLARAGVSPIPAAHFFERMGKAEGRLAEGLAYLSSHPPSAERQRQFRKSAVRGKAYRPALSEAEWKALTRICRSTGPAAAR